MPLPEEGINVQVGKTTYIRLIKEVTINEPYPYSDCKDLTNYKSILFDFIKNSENAYRQKSCLDLCYQMSTIENCGCYDLESLKFTSDKPCHLNDTDYFCLVNNYRQFVTEENNVNCSIECPLECVTERYQINSQFSDYPSRAYIKSVLNENISSKKKVSDTKFSAQDEEETYQIYKNQYLEVNIYFDDYKYVSISETRKTSEIDLISSIGGTLGLFIGISLLSIIEVVELIAEIILILFNKFMMKRNRIYDLSNK